MEATAMGRVEQLSEDVERREGHDLRMPFPVEVRCVSDVRGGTRRYLALNLSEGGVFLITLLPLETGSLLRLTFSVPDGKGPVQVLAKVAWTRSASPVREAPGGMGVRFLDLGKADQRRIQSALG